VALAVGAEVGGEGVHDAGEALGKAVGGIDQDVAAADEGGGWLRGFDIEVNRAGVFEAQLVEAGVEGGDFQAVFDGVPKGIAAGGPTAQALDEGAL
jgi:hypothetical protein